jgi:Fe-S-cluster containining protein
MSFVVINLEQARFECTFGRGCEGLCCRNGRPPVYPEEERSIDAVLLRIVPTLRPEARVMLEKSGYLSRRRKAAQRMLRVVGGWCVFFNQGCTLHRLGASEGAAFRYKPAACSLFPLTRDDRGWYVRQMGYKGEIWDLPCLNPDSTRVPATESLVQEIAMAAGQAHRGT